MFIYTHNLDPVAFAFNIFDYQLQIRWYSLAYIAGLLIASSWLKYCNNKQSILSKQAYENWLTWAIIGIVIGGRLGYVIFYQFSYYWHNPLDILKIWHGGMSFHGGLVGTIISMYFFSKKYNFNIWWLLDRLAVIAPIGLCLGRIANFINGELYGRFTNADFGVIFADAGDLPRHPSQLYEATLEGLVLLSIMLFCFFCRPNAKFNKFLSGLFLLGYATIRFICEFFRQPDENLGFFFKFFSMGQLLCLPMLLFGLLLIFLSKNHKNEYQH